jgi:hypothetical protein
MLHARAKSKGEAKTQLGRKKRATELASQRAGAPLEPEVLEQMELGIEAAVAAAQLFKGKGAIDVSAAASTTEDSVRIVIEASR